MASTDFIADFLTTIRNASRARKEKLTAPTSRTTTRIAHLLKEEGFIENYKCFNEGDKNFIRIHLKYMRGRQSAIQGIRRVSKPGRRIYVASGEIPRVLGGLGVSLVSTSKGVLVDREAKKSKIGGELICKVW